MKRWTLTLNNPSEGDISTLTTSARKLCEYAILAREIAPTSKTPHIQGFLVLKKRQRLASIKPVFGSRIHFEPARATVPENIAYCSKDGDIILTHGVPPSGHGGSSKMPPRSRESIAKEFKKCLDLKRHEGICDFADLHPGTWFFNGRAMLDAWVLAHREVCRPEIEVAWFHGPPGTGKSLWAQKLMPRAYYKDSCTKWWHGYMFETQCIIDDLAPNHININHLLKWFDRYRNKVETKGGMLPLHCSQFIITSNYSPEECYPNEKQLPALLRRLSIVRLFGPEDTTTLIKSLLES